MSNFPQIFNELMNIYGEANSDLDRQFNLTYDYQPYGPHSRVQLIVTNRLNTLQDSFIVFGNCLHATKLKCQLLLLFLFKNRMISEDTLRVFMFERQVFP